MYKTTFHVKICSSKKSIPTMEGTFALEPPPLEFPFEGGGGGAWITPLPGMMKHYISTSKIIFGAV